jgi:putative lipoprotein
LKANLETSTREESLRRFLREQIRKKQFPGKDDTRYARALVDLNGDGKEEAIVFLEGRWWCGSGGCATLILTPEAVSWSVVAMVVTTDTPIRVLKTRSHGWRNITVITHDPGAAPYEAELQFDGKTYPFSPRIPVPKHAKGKVVISSPGAAIPLYR